MPKNRITISEYLKNRLYSNILNIGSFSDEKAKKELDKFYKPGGVLDEILKHAKIRKIMGAFRYSQKDFSGLSYDEKAKLGEKDSYLKRLENKVEDYKNTGNKEYLVDVFNYVMLEWNEPSLSNTFFKSTERKEE